MRIVLINPRYGKEVFPCEPFGLMYIQAFMEQRNYKVDITDLNLFDDSGYFNRIIQNGEEGIYAISVYTDNRESVKDIICKIRSSNSNSKIILGGHHVTSLPEVSLRLFDADFVIRGEGEHTFYDLVVNLKNGCGVEDIAGISYKNGDKIIHNIDRKFISDISLLPYPKRNKENFDYYTFYNKYLQGLNLTKNIKAGGVIMSRGCSYNCTYCSIQNFWKRSTRYRSIPNVLNEIKELKLKGVNFIFFWDDIFTLKRSRVLELCFLLIREKVNISWCCLTRFDLVDIDLLNIMKEAGCKMISFGLESGSSVIRSNINKDIDNEQIINIGQYTKQIGIKLRISLLIGSPGENEHTINETKKCLIKIKPDAWSVNILRIYPNTHIYSTLNIPNEELTNYWNDNKVKYYDRNLNINKLLKYKFEIEGLLENLKHKT